MWLVAGVLLGVVVLVALVGFHTGPHAHVAAGVLGLVAGGWLVAMAIDDKARTSLLFALLGADLVVSGGVGFAAWRGLSSRRSQLAGGSPHSVEGAMGVAVGGLSPNGVVRIRGESWSATSLNGTVPDGAAVQVISVEGVRLNVWGEESSGATAELAGRAGGHWPEPDAARQDRGSTSDAGRPPSGAGTGGVEL